MLLPCCESGLFLPMVGRAGQRSIPQLGDGVVALSGTAEFLWGSMVRSLALNSFHPARMGMAGSSLAVLAKAVLRCWEAAGYRMEVQKEPKLLFTGEKLCWGSWKR